MSALRALAAHLGICARYVDQEGVLRHTSDATRVALLAAMGVDAATDRKATRALRALRAEAAARLLTPARVLVGEAQTVRVVPGLRRSVHWIVEIHEEGGRIHRTEGRHRGRSGAIVARCGAPLPAGYHRLRLAVRFADGREREEEQSLIVAPPRCPRPADVLGKRRVFGLLANLYTLRSARNWGIGNLGDLGALARWGGAIGAAFVGVNPLHALDIGAGAVSPYSPLSRLFRNPLYLDLTAVPELAESAAARARLASAAFQSELARLRASATVEYERLAALERPVLVALHRAFATRQRDGDDTRARAYRRYRDAQGDNLVDFATFLALRERHARDWHRWPAAYRDPRSATVRRFRDSHRAEIDRHCWVQFELDRQLATAARHARSAGMTLGIYEDLALGSAPSGSDPWAFPTLFLGGVSVGAPPDTLAPQGQNWGLPPIDPRALARDGYRYWIALLRAAFRHAGALRMDHVMGLFRQFWIPAGGSAADGTYVRFPEEALLAILALESTRAGALVIGEDLGTVPPGLPRILARWGILSTRVLYFERGTRGFFPATHYPARALVSANTHDLAPLAGFWEGSDLALRRATGQIAGEAALTAARRARAADRRMLLRRLVRAGLLAPGREPSGLELRAAVHAFLCRTPAALVGISLDDLVGESIPVNLPGVTLDDYPSWQRRLTTPIETLAHDPEVRRALSGTRERRLARRRSSWAPRRVRRLLR